VASVGANTWIWTSPLSDERLASLAPRVRGLGFDVIELPVEGVGDWDPARAAELLERARARCECLRRNARGP